MTLQRLTCITGTLLLSCAAAQAQLDLSLAGKIDLAGGGEIVSYTRDGYTLASTFYTGNDASSTQGVNLYTFDGAGASYRATADFSSIYGKAGTYSVSSVALDPLGRGFGVATIIPTENTTVKSSLAFFDYTTGALLRTVEVGFHADSVTFSRDGSQVVVANEGEANAGTSAANDGSDAAGSVSVVSLAGVSQLSDVASIAAPVTVDFSAGNLSSGASLAGVRNPYLAAVGNPGNSAGQQTLAGAVPDFSDPANIDPAGIEPEYVVAAGGKVYASLQENNAIGVLDTATGKWEKILNLGTIAQTIDATNTGATANINQMVSGMPMPDTIALVNIGGTDYIVTANEGDARIDDRDETRFGDTSGSDALNPVLDASFPTTATGVRSNSELGRLNISRIDGDTDGDGDIDVPVMFGTRSFSIWNAQTGALVSDSGSLESLLLSLDPARFNVNRDEVNIDNRSDDKGPEPEALSVFTSGGKTYAAVGLERQNGILLFNISNPFAPVYVDYLNGLDFGLVSPESLLYVPAEDSPTGLAYLLGGFEGAETGELAGVGIFAATPVPEPAAMGLAAGAGLVGLVLLRRRSRVAAVEKNS